MPSGGVHTINATDCADCLLLPPRLLLVQREGLSLIGAREAASRNENRQDRVQDQSGKRMCVSRRCGDATVHPAGGLRVGAALSFIEAHVATETEIHSALRGSYGVGRLQWRPIRRCCILSPGPS